MNEWLSDNPAGRLHVIMQGITDADGTQQTIQIIRHVLGISESALNHMFFDIAAFIDLAAQTHVLVKSLDGENHDLLLGWQPGFNSALEVLTNFQSPAEKMSERFTVTDLKILEFCADTLHRHMGEPIFIEGALAELIDLVRSAADAIGAETDLPVKLRLILVDRLNDITRALQHVNISGYSGVETAIDTLLGTVIREPAAAKSKSTMSWVQKIMAAVGLASTGLKQVESGFESGKKILEIAQQTMQ